MMERVQNYFFWDGERGEHSEKEPPIKRRSEWRERVTKVLEKQKGPATGWGSPEIRSNRQLL
jgi:hypothetical protein